MEFEARMKPRAIGAKEDLAGPALLDCLNQIIKLTDSRCVRIHVRILSQLIGHLLVCPPVIGEASQMRDDEVHVRICPSKHVHDPRTANDVYEHGEAESSGSFAYLARR